MFSYDLALMEIIGSNGADLNMVDGIGNTPLLSLCDAAAFRGDNSCNVSPASDSDVARKALFEEDLKAQLRVKTDFLHYLLKRKDTDVSAS